MRVKGFLRSRFWRMALLFAAFFAVSFAVAAEAGLPDAEYERMLKECPEFAEADKHMNETWKILTNAANPQNMQKYRDNQRHWISTVRQESAARMPELKDEVPWSRSGSSAILSNGLIDSTAGDYAIYKIAGNGHTVMKIASSEPYDYPEEASLEEAKWRFFINGKQVDYEFYEKYLSEQGYSSSDREKNIAAVIDWKNID